MNLFSFFRKESTTTQQSTQPEPPLPWSMREEIFTVASMTPYSPHKVFVRTVFTGDKAVSFGYDLKTGSTSNYVEIIAEAVRDTYSIPESQHVFIEIDQMPHKPPKYELVAMENGTETRWQSITDPELQAIVKELPPYIYAPAPNHLYLEEIHDIQKELIRFTNNCCDLWKVVDPLLTTDEQKQEFHALFSYCECDFKDGEFSFTEAEFGKSHYPLQYLLVDKDALKKLLQSCKGREFRFKCLTRDDGTMLVDAWEAAVILTDAFQSGSSLLFWPPSFEFSEKIVQQMREISNYCIYGWVFSIPRQSIFIKDLKTHPQNDTTHQTPVEHG